MTNPIVVGVAPRASGSSSLAHSCACPLIVLPRQHRAAADAVRETAVEGAA